MNQIKVLDIYSTAFVDSSKVDEEWIIDDDMLRYIDRAWTITDFDKEDDGSTCYELDGNWWWPEECLVEFIPKSKTIPVDKLWIEELLEKLMSSDDIARLVEYNGEGNATYNLEIVVRRKSFANRATDQ